MGCGKSKGKGKQEHTPEVGVADLKASSDHDLYGHANGALSFGWGRPGAEVVVEPQASGDPPFMQTVAPGGTSWGQYIRTRSSFVDPNTGLLAGPWAECIAWAVLYEHMVDWDTNPAYPEEGVVGPVLEAFEDRIRKQGNLDTVALMLAAEALEDAAHEHAETGESMSDVRQVLSLPAGAVPGSLVWCDNSQAPGSLIMVKVPSAQPVDGLVLVAVPVQPSKSGALDSEEATFALGSLPPVGPGEKASGMWRRAGKGARSDGPKCAGEFEAEAVDDAEFLQSLF